MKKLILGIVLMVTGALFAYAQQYCPESDFRIEPVGGGVSIRIVAYVGNNWTVRIPPVIRNLPVTHIGSNAFMGRTLTSVTIPNSVTHIESGRMLSGRLQSGAFFNNQLTSVIIPDSITYIGVGAFSRNLLSSVTIPDNVSVGIEAFFENELTEITIGENVALGRGFDSWHALFPYSFNRSVDRHYNQHGRVARIYRRDETGSWRWWYRQ